MSMGKTIYIDKEFSYLYFIFFHYLIQFTYIYHFYNVIITWTLLFRNNILKWLRIYSYAFYWCYWLFTSYLMSDQCYKMSILHIWFRILYFVWSLQVKFSYMWFECVNKFLRYLVLICIGEYIRVDQSGSVCRMTSQVWRHLVPCG